MSLFAQFGSGLSRTDTQNRQSTTPYFDETQPYDFKDSDSTKVDSTKQIHYVKRDYSHKEQVIVGVSIMGFIALMLISMNNYNPKR